MRPPPASLRRPTIRPPDLGALDLRTLGLTAQFYAAVAGWAVILLVALSGYACSPRWVEQRLQTQAEAALRDGGFGFASVKMDGQIAVLTGYAASAEEIAAAKAAVLAAAGPGGPWTGGVTAVREFEFRALSPPVSPFAWRAERIEGGVRMSGSTPSVQARERLTARAAALFAGAPVEDLATAAAGAPAGPPWVDVAELALAQLARLNAGDVRLTDATLIVSGEATASAADAIRAALRDDLPTPYVGVADVLAPGQDLGAPQLQGLTLRGADVDACQQAFDTVLRGKVITFDQDSAALSPSGFPLLDTLARIARRCDQYSIEVSGHTSSEGERNLNQTLSKARAESVVAYLVQRGVRKERLAAEGYGPDRPIASNLASAGRAANRRIEFAVSR